MIYLKKIISYFLCFIFTFLYIFTSKISVEAASENDIVEIDANSAVLMEASTGEILYEKNAESKVSPASITKIMTLLLIFEAIDKNEISINDEVVTSAYAKSMGGSQVYLEEGEIQTVDTLIKCIVVSSGNDASVTMAEYIAGSESEFVNRMNEKAKQLGMDNTHFLDCTGLCDDDNHYSSAKDVAIMTREIIIKYPEIKNYSSIWTENIVHKTKKGESEFGLSNTNKLLKSYQYTTGLKTGSTSKAKYCLSATAIKDDIEMIAVIMGAKNHKDRFNEAKTLLEYGYNNYYVYKDLNEDKLNPIKVSGAILDEIKIEYRKEFTYLCSKDIRAENIRKQIILNENIDLPIKKNQVIGKAKYTCGERELGEVDIISIEDVYKKEYTNYLHKLFSIFCN